jgi:pantothenate kinase
MNGLTNVVSQERFVEWLTAFPEHRLIGIAGIPGAGKSTVAEAFARRFPASPVVPMDGYHLPRRMLDASGLRRRGSPPTFDAHAFRVDLMKMRRTRTGIFPGWDHAAKDPSPEQIRVAEEAPRVFVEGNYLLLRAWDTQPLFDVTVFVDCPVEIALARVERRLVDCGIVADAEAARQQVDANDRLNAELILADGCRERADFVINP